MVEGPDDEHVVKNVCGAHGLGRIDEVRPYGGKDSLLEGIEVRLKESEVEAVGILLDADADLSARWQSVRDRLIAAGFGSIPAAPPPEGLILEPPAGTLLPRVGVWLMPNNELPGILEDFLALLVPSGDALFERIKSCVEGIPKELVRFSVERKPKALIHAWLAVQEEPGRPLGQAVTARYLNSELPAAHAFVEWLRRLFF